MSIIHQNVQCLNNKVEDLEVFLDGEGCDVLCLTEHWYTHNNIESVGVAGFSLLSHFSRQSGIHGGAAIFVNRLVSSSDTFSASNMDEIDRLSTEFSFECSAVKIKYLNFSFIVLAIYRSGGGDFEVFNERFGGALEVLSRYPNYSIFICGDFNVNFLSSSPELDRFTDLIASYGIMETVDEPTRLGSCLDNICTDVASDCRMVSVIHNGLSDHSAQKIIFFELLTKPRPTNKLYRELNNQYNMQNFRDMLKNEDWRDVQQNEDPSCQYDNFLKIVSHYFELAFPLRKEKNLNKNKIGWITRGIRISSEKLKTLHFLIQNGNVDLKVYYGKYKKIYKKVIRAAKLLHNNILMNNASNMTRTAWNIINAQTNKLPKATKIELECNGEIIKDPDRVALYFNEYFNGVAKTVGSVDHGDFDCSNIAVNSSSLFMHPTDEYELKKIISGLKSSHSCGLDGISANMIKNCVDELVCPLVVIINTSLSHGVFADQLKIAKIRPIHKRDSHLIIDNYRPISLISTFAKILEKVVARRLMNFLDKCNILNPSQFGFRRGRSTSSAIINFLNILYKNMDSNKSCMGIFLDLSKAFDLVNHTTLLQKLDRYGIRGVALDWFTSYLRGRMHYVELGGIQSNLLQLSCGVPQGSVLGPLLYILYVNDLVVPNCTMFADDTSVLICTDGKSDLAPTATSVLDQLDQFFLKNDLRLNSQKSVCVEFSAGPGGRVASHLIRCGGSSVAQVDETGFLGMTIERNCGWTQHVGSLCGRLASICFVLRRLRSCLVLSVLRSYYFAHFHSVLSYGLIAWGSCGNSIRVFRLQKRALRVMVGMGTRESCRELFRSMRIMTLPSIFIYQLLLYVRGNMENFRSLGLHHNYNTRSASLLEIPQHRLTLFEKSPDYLAIKVYNKLPPKYLTLSINRFKATIRELFIEKCYYSLVEYLDDAFLL